MGTNYKISRPDSQAVARQVLHYELCNKNRTISRASRSLDLPPH
jgi:hypothetical protein